MTKEEFKKLTEKYEKASRDLNSYREQFFTSYTNGVLKHSATKTLNKDEMKKFEAKKKHLDSIEKQWLDNV